jgi:hypothetical protein
LYTSVALVWVALVVALNLRWFIERVRGFSPSKAIIEPKDEAAFQNTITLELNR